MYYYKSEQSIQSNTIAMNNVVGQIPDGPSDRQKYMLVVGQFSNPDQPGSSRQLPSQSFSPYFMSPQHYLDALAPASEFQLQHQRSPQQLQQQQHMHMQMQMQHQQHLTPQQLMQIQLQLQQQQHPVRYPYPGPHHPHQVQIGGQPIFPQTRHQLTTQQSPQQQQQQSPNQLPPRTIQQQQSPTPPPPQQPKQQQKIKTTHLLAPKKDETNSNGHKPTKNQSTQAKLQNVKKEEYLIHFIDGLNIIESSEPLSDKKAKKKKKLKQQQQQHSQQQPQPQSQPQPLQPQINTQPPPQPRAQPRPQPQPMPHLIPQPHMPPNRHHQQQQQQQQQQVHPLPAQQLAQPQSLPTATPNQRTNSPASIRAEMPNWSVTDVVRFIEQHEDIKQYAEKFREDEVDGKALLLMIDRNLKLEVLTSMFRYGPAMKVEATLSKYKLND